MFQGLKGKRRVNIAQEVRDIIKVNSHGAVQIGDLRKYEEVHKVVSPKFERYHYHGAYDREGVDKQTHWEREEVVTQMIFLNTEVTDSQWWPPLVDEDKQVRCPARYVEADGPEGGHTCIGDPHQDANGRKAN